MLHRETDQPRGARCFPPSRGEGGVFDLVWGSYIELAETSYIQGSSGWLNTIEYKGKGYFSGKSYSFKATLKPPLPRSSRNRSLSTHHLRNIDESGILRRDVGEGGDYAACGGELEALGRGDSGERFRECKSGEDED